MKGFTGFVDELRGGAVIPDSKENSIMTKLGALSGTAGFMVGGNKGEEA